ncbi:MAG: HAMP domain-containing histidine kinase [Planctomycetes bacterium]|nr:HAMP domain-containing histidine kinase [Planctomycetota bacterium]
MRARLSVSWTISILAAACIPLAVLAWATFSVLESSALDGAERVRTQTAAAARAVLANQLEAGRDKLAAIAAVLGQPDAMTKLERNAYVPNEARALDGLLAPRDVFLELGVRRLVAPNAMLAQAQTKDFGATQQEAFSNNSLPLNRNFDAGLQQFVEELPPDDPRVAAARRGESWIAADVERAGELRTLALAQPLDRERLLTARLDLEPVRVLLEGLCADAARGIELVDAAGAPILSAGRPLDGPAALETRVPAGHGAWSLRVSEAREETLRPLANARRALGLALGLALTLGVVLSVLFARKIVAPVRALAATAERFGAGEFDARSGIARGDEIGQLAAAFDRMAASLAELDRLKSEFVEHVSHELRTPLTSARLALANVEEGLAGPDALARVRADLDRLVRMVEELLDLARIEAGIELARAPMRLEDAARAAAETVQPLSRVEIEVRGASDELELDAARVHQVLVNLLDNAAKHARTRAWVVVEPRGFVVGDDGPGVPEAERERVFERFVRLDPAGTTPGAGLGLSIAKKLVLLHGGTIRCTDAGFVVRFEGAN